MRPAPPRSRRRCPASAPRRPMGRRRSTATCAWRRRSPPRRDGCAWRRLSAWGRGRDWSGPSCATSGGATSAPVRADSWWRSRDAGRGRCRCLPAITARSKRRPPSPERATCSAGGSPSRRNLSEALNAALSGDPSLPRLEPGRLRSTWLCECAQLVGLRAFMEAAGLRCSQRLGDLVAELPRVEEETAVALLGGGGRGG